MWLLRQTPGLMTDLYELTMGQVYFDKQLDGTACFEVTVRHLPPRWGFFVMAGLEELAAYLEAFRFDEEDVAWLRGTGRFSEVFLGYLGGLRLDVDVRAMPEGTVFFAGEPVVEVRGPLIAAQLLESYVLNVLGFSIIEASLAARVRIAAAGKAIVDFGLRRTQGPVAALRAARGGMMAGFAATSNVFAARALGFTASGTMAHSYVEAHESEREAFADFAEAHGEDAVLLVDTYEPFEGIRTGADVAGGYLRKHGLRIKGIRLDSGDLAEQARFARRLFDERGLGFMEIFASGGLDEYRVAELVETCPEIDGYGIGTRFGVSREAPDVDIAYKLVRYGERNVFKTSPGKVTRPGRKSVVRITEGGRYVKDVVCPMRREVGAGDLLVPFGGAEEMGVIQERLQDELSKLSSDVKRLEGAQAYPVEFVEGE
ncbi:MAG: nicotinate phosphoribosyltransferase [Phycisphaerae bacterium]|nr:nicotinate phosphoribosyltransferase [Phycisphaerae bacterium]